jgi:AcrR family transcriptional regulator
MVDKQVLRGARAVIGAHGLRGATLERIAGAAGVSRMTLHRRGVTREAILEELGREFESAYREAFWPALTSPAAAPERLRSALQAQCLVEERYLDISGALAQAETDRLFHEPGPDAPTRDVFIAPLRRILADGVSEGSLRSDDPESTATALFNLVSSTYRHLRSGHHWSEQRAAAILVDVALNGVAA